MHKTLRSMIASIADSVGVKSPSGVLRRLSAGSASAAAPAPSPDSSWSSATPPHHRPPLPSIRHPPTRTRPHREKPKGYHWCHLHALGRAGAIGGDGGTPAASPPPQAPERFGRRAGAQVARVRAAHLLFLLTASVMLTAARPARSGTDYTSWAAACGAHAAAWLAGFVIPGAPASLGGRETGPPAPPPLLPGGHAAEPAAVVMNRVVGVSGDTILAAAGAIRRGRGSVGRLPPPRAHRREPARTAVGGGGSAQPGCADIAPCGIVDSNLGGAVVGAGRHRSGRLRVPDVPR